MLRRIGRLPSFFLSRSHTSYDTKLLSHEELIEKYSKDYRKDVDVLQLLENTEAEIFNWKRNKWEFRVPPLLSSLEKEKALQQQELLKNFCLVQGNLANSVKQDLSTVSSITGIPVDAVRGKNRTWLQEQTAKLRWQGDVNKAKALRDAFLRLEVCGSRDHRLLERLCCIYGMGIMGAYDDAFSRVIKEDPVTKKLVVQNSNPFIGLLAYIVTVHPHIGIIYDLLGFNVTCGYRSSLRDLIVSVLHKKHNISDSPPNAGRVAFMQKSELFFDFADSCNTISTDDSVYGLPDFLFIRDNDFFLITIASSNYWLRSRQVPHKKQLEGIARRGSFVLGVPFEKVRIRNFLLPPNYVDKASLVRLSGDVLGLSASQQEEFLPWLSLYTKETDADDVDFAETVKRLDLEEWQTL